ncbi:MAG: hypothetical protein AB8B59_06025 [Maribacter sp.]
MNKLRQTPFKMLTLLLCFIATGAFGQKQTKSFKEDFKVSTETLLDINTSHADIEFETWSKNEVEILATIEIDGATEEEAKKYFENSGFEILGNSKKVSVSTDNGSAKSWAWNHALGDVQNFHIEVPEFPEMESFEYDIYFDFEELTNLPIPPMVDFDHKAFKENGAEYLKNWQKEFENSYDEEHVKKLEEWAKRMEEKREKMTKKREEMMEKREEMQEKRAEERSERMEKMAEARAERMQQQQERRMLSIERNVSRNNSANASRVVVINGDSISTFTNGGPNVFYSSSGGEHKNYKVKKTIKVKMPKGMKIKMDVRHGEVKLAGNTMHLNAILSHSSLWAASIGGDGTNITASYSPINVKTWNYGQLQTKYSENVALEEVIDLKLNSTSSDVTIDNLVNSAFIKNDFGPLQIKSISNNFKDLDITLQNAELKLKTPSVPFTIYVNGTSSKLTAPTSITINKTDNHGNTIHRGYYKNKSATSTIVINSKYSEVVID